MAAESGRADPPLDEILLEEGYRFDFFQAVRVLERLHPSRSPVGYNAPPANEAARFRSHLALTFPPSAIHEVIAPEKETNPTQVVVAFMGLFGFMGALPKHYTELLLERIRRKDFTLRDFLDIFNHRFISLFYRAWEKYRFPSAYERARVGARDEYDPFSRLLFHLVGMGTGGLRGRLKTGDEVLLYYAGLVAQQPRSASSLGALISDYFAVPATTQQFRGAWLRLDAENRTILGRNELNGQLGSTAILGSRFWDQQSGFRLVLGALDLKQFRKLLPSERGFRSLVELTRFFVGMTLDFDVQLVLKAAEVPFCRLQKPRPNALQLGWTSWLKSKPFSHDASDAVLGRHLTKI